MKYTRVRSYKVGERCQCAEHLYTTDSHVTALERFLDEYPEHRECIQVADSIDSDLPKYKEYVSVCARCEVIN